MIVTRVCPGQRGEIRTVSEEIMMAVIRKAETVQMVEHDESYNATEK